MTYQTPSHLVFYTLEKNHEARQGQPDKTKRDMNGT